MGGAPTFDSKGLKSALWGCLLVLGTVVAVWRFTPMPVIVAGIAVGAVFFSAAFVEKALDGSSIAVRSAATLLIQLAAVITIALVTPGLHRRASFVTIAALVIAVTHAGTAAVDLYRSRTIIRLSRASRVVLLSYARESVFSSTLESRALAYYGLLLGFGVGVALMQNGILVAQSPVTLPLLGALVGAGAFLFIEICRNGVLMADPLYEPALKDEARVRLSGRLRPVLEVNDQMIGALPLDDQIGEVACAAADLRKTVFWSSVFASGIFLALSMLIEQVLTLKAPTAWFIVPTILVLFLLVQLPYVWGQVQLHENLLEAREGVQRSELQEKLLKLSPLLPRVPALMALTATGTAGGLLYGALSKILSGVTGSG